MYQPPYDMTDEMWKICLEITELVGNIRSVGDAWNQLHLRRSNRIRSIYSSLRIEANSLSLEQVSDIINGKRVVGDPNDIQEVKNAQRAYQELRSLDPFSLEDLKKIHSTMTEGLVGSNGVFRTHAEGVFAGDTCIYVAPPPELVSTYMENLFEWMRENQEKVHPLIMSAVFHYEFVFIHPFSDGNGRMARLWHTLLLMNWRPLFEYIPLESQIEKFQQEYYDVIAMCNAEGKSNRFIVFMLYRIKEILEEAYAEATKDPSILSDQVQMLMYNMESSRSYSSSELLRLLSIRSKENLRDNYLHPALDSGLIEMTVPDKPTSRNQRYRKKK